MFTGITSVIKSTGNSVASVGEYFDGYDYSDTIQRAGENVINNNSMKNYLKFKVSIDQ